MCIKENFVRSLQGEQFRDHYSILKGSLKGATPKRGEFKAYQSNVNNSLFREKISIWYLVDCFSQFESLINQICRTKGETFVREVQTLIY